jgi:hypothetical protein
MAGETLSRNEPIASIEGIDPADWKLVVKGRRNVILCGPKRSVDLALSALHPHLRQPVLKFSDDTDVPLQSVSTVIVADVHTLSHERQHMLLRALDVCREDVQVVSTCVEPLFERVRRREFLAELYYRLNTILLELTD